MESQAPCQTPSPSLCRLAQASSVTWRIKCRDQMNQTLIVLLPPQPAKLSENISRFEDSNHTFYLPERSSDFHCRLLKKNWPFLSRHQWLLSLWTFHTTFLHTLLTAPPRPRALRIVHESCSPWESEGLTQRLFIRCLVNKKIILFHTEMLSCGFSFFILMVVKFIVT